MQKRWSICVLVCLLGAFNSACAWTMGGFYSAPLFGAGKRMYVATAPDTTAPTILSVNSDKANGTYGVGEVIDIDLTFSEAITCTGNLVVTLETGTTDRAVNMTVSASSTATGNYTVQSGDTSADLTVASISGTCADLASSPNAMSNFTPATNLAANKALVIDTSGGGGSGTLAVTIPDMTASNFTSRTSCVAPCAVYFDAQTVSASSLTSRPFHELLYQWNFGDPVAGAAGTCTDGAPVARDAGQGSYCTGTVTGNANLDSKNYAEGPEAAHVFESPGTFTVTLTTSQGDSNFNSTLDTGEFKRGTVTVTVSDPNTVFSSTTACVANGATPVAGSNGCPSGATGLYNSGDADAVLATAITAGYRRLLFRRGDTFTFSTFYTVGAAGPGLIGAYGSGAKPIFLSSGASQLRVNASDWRVVDIKQDVNQTGPTYVGVYSDTTGVNNTLLLRVDTVGGQAFKTSGSSLGAVTSGLWDGIFVFDSTCSDPYHSADNGLNCYYVSGFRVALVGNHVDMNQWSEHGIRTYASRSVISHNTTEDIATGRSSITQRSLDWTGGEGAPASTYSGIAIQSQNREIGNGPGGAFGAMLTEQTNSNERCKDVIFERNFTNNIGLDMMCSQVSVRNNILRGTTRNISSKVTGSELTIVPMVTDVWWYNNTVTTTVTGDMAILYATDSGSRAGSDTTAIIFQNNLQYTPNDSTYGDNVTIFFANVVATTCASCNTNGSGELRTNPLFATYPPTAPSHLVPQSGSYAIGRGVAVPVWNDFFGSWQPATRDIGAVIH